MAIGRAIRKHRKAKGLSQEELAHLAGHHRNHTGRIERGEHNPKVSVYLDFAEALGIAPSLLFEDIKAKSGGH